jgi:hypothetical protein
MKRGSHNKGHGRGSAGHGVIAKARAAGEAEVHATGDAIVRRVRDVVMGLRAAGVTVYLAGDLGRTNWETL